jgi:hypothetical protein
VSVKRYKGLTSRLTVLEPTQGERVLTIRLCDHPNTGNVGAAHTTLRC